MSIILINPFALGSSGGGGGSQAVVNVARTATAAGTSGITIVSNFFDASEAAASIQANDIILAYFAHDDDDTIGEEVGFDPITGSPVLDDPNNNALSLMWARASVYRDYNESDPGQFWLGGMAQFRYVKASGNPWNVLGSGLLTASTSLTIPGVTTSVNNCLVCVFVVAGGGSSATSGWTCASLTSFDEPYASGCDSNTALGSHGGANLSWASGVKATAGATGNITVTQASSRPVCYMVVALEPASP